MGGTFLDQRQHGAAQGLRPANPNHLVRSDRAECLGDQLDSCIAIDGPVRDQQGTGPGIEERAGKT